MLYPVEQKWIDVSPQQGYRAGVGAWEGVVLHFTDNYTSSIDGEVSFMTNNYPSSGVYVHEFVAADRVVQTADPQYRAQGAGKYANPRYIHIELCVAHNLADFTDSLDRWCQRAAYYLSQRGLGVVPASAKGDGVLGNISGTLWSHWDVTKLLGGTTHQDPIEYLGKWGIQWRDVIIRVQSWYKQLTEPEVDEMDRVLEYDQWAWDELNEYVGAAYNDDIIGDWSWVQKVRDKKLTYRELLLLKVLIDERRRTKERGVRHD